MAVFKVNHTTNFTVMSNTHFKDKRLSLKAKGLLSQMLSLPEEWDYTVNGLVAINKESKTAIQSTLKELEECGYLVRTRLRDDSGHFSYQYDIYEEPQPENPFTVNPTTENHPQSNTNKSNTKKLNTNNKNIDDEFEAIWKDYPRKLGKANALKAYKKARKNGVDYDTIRNGLMNYISYIQTNKVDEKYIKHGSTWFNQNCWNDEYESNKGINGVELLPESERDHSLDHIF